MRRFVCAVDEHGILPALNTLHSAWNLHRDAEVWLATNAVGIQKLQSWEVSNFSCFPMQFWNNFRTWGLSIPNSILDHNGPRFSHITLGFLYRLLLDQIPNSRLTISLDYDTVVQKPLDDMFTLIEDRDVVGISDRRTTKNPYHPNASLIGFNGAKFWVQDSFRQMRHWIIDNPSMFQEEDAMRKFWFEDRKEIPPTNIDWIWHAGYHRKELLSDVPVLIQSVLAHARDCKTLHFISKTKPWSIPKNKFSRKYLNRIRPLYLPYDVVGVCRGVSC